MRRRNTSNEFYNVLRVQQDTAFQIQSNAKNALKAVNDSKSVMQYVAEETGFASRSGVESMLDGICTAKTYRGIIKGVSIALLSCLNGTSTVSIENQQEFCVRYVAVQRCGIPLSKDVYLLVRKFVGNSNDVHAKYVAASKQFGVVITIPPPTRVTIVNLPRVAAENIMLTAKAFITGMPDPEVDRAMAALESEYGQWDEWEEWDGDMGEEFRDVFE
jgi:hypothetical protein